MISLTLTFTIFVLHLLALVTADNDNYFIYPPPNPNFSSYAPDVAFGTFNEGANITLQWVTTWDSVHILLSQNDNPFPLPLPNSQNLSSSSSYTWIVDLSGDGGNPSFNLDRGQEFNFLLVQNGRDAAGLAGDSIWSEWFTITNTASASSSSTPLSTASTSSTTTLATSSSTTSTSTSKNMASALKGLSKGARIGMALSLLAAIFGIGA